MRFDRQSWLARLSFTFFAIAGLLVYDGYRLTRAGPEASRTQLALYAVAAALSLVLGLAGLRARHRRDSK
jgi:hypothetical protein